MPAAEREVLEGYVADLACLRKYPRAELLERARAHSKSCNLMGHCIESGYGLVGDDSTIALLDSSATPQVLEALRGSVRDVGIRLRVERERQDGEQRTVKVEELSPA